MAEKLNRPWQAGGSGGTSSDGNHAQRYPTTSAGGGQVRHGRIVDDVWLKPVRGSVHRLRVPAAWAVDAADLDAAEGLGVAIVHIHDLEALRHYWATVETIRRRGFALDRDHGRQVALSLDWWRSTRAEAEALDEELRGPAPTVRQLALFGRAP